MKLVLVVSCLCTVGLAAQSNPQWRYTAPADVTFFFVTPTGHVVVGTAAQVAGLDPGTGAVSWTREALQGAKARWWLTTPGDTSYGLLDLGDRLEVLDLQSGAKRWDSPALSITSVTGYLAVPAHGLLLVYGGSSQDSSVLVGVDLASGQVRWRHANPFAVEPKRYRALTSRKDEFGSSLAGEQGALSVTDSTFLLYISEDGPVLVNGKTGAFLWRAESLRAKRPPARRDKYPAIVVAESVAYIPAEKELHAIRLRDGSPLWSAPAEFPSRVIQLEVTSAGLLVRGVRREFDAIRDGSFVDLLDPGTGVSRWPKQYKRGWSALHPSDAPATISPFVVRGDRVYFASDGKVYAIILRQGSVAELGKVKFKGDEEPTVVESRAEGVLLLSPQNALLVDTTGAERYQAHYPAPRGGLLDRVLGVRYTAAYHSPEFFYTLTSGKDSSGQARSSLVKLSKDRNRLEGRVWLSDTHPDFDLDVSRGAAYVMTGPREIVAFKF